MTGRRIHKTRAGRLVLTFLLLLLVLFFIGGLFVPRPLFNTSYSTVVESSEGELLGARISGDEQWRFPPVDSIPDKYGKCVLSFEDKYFYAHPGVNLFSLARAFFLNVKARRIVSGGSTITMQLCRLARGQKERSVWNKLIEIFWALHVELRYSKSEILELYASHAPFGGNVVGLDAAAWRYFGRDPGQLSWAESATLAVLPNAPSLIYPGRLDQRLKQKRDKLLNQLLVENEMDSITYQLAISEPLPGKVNALPDIAFHLTEKANAEKRGQRIHSTIQYGLQNRVNEIVARHHQRLKSNLINNMAVLVVEIPSKKVLAYVGNTNSSDSIAHGNQVDIVQSPRSTGSILKPFLYCKMLDEGLLLPTMLVPDIPIRFGGFTPMNFDREYNGAVPAEEALARSLNIPAVHLLRDFGVGPLYSFLRKTGMSTLKEQPGHYGLSLILGGAEIELWDLAGMYASLGTILKRYENEDGFYSSKPFSPLIWDEEIPVLEEQRTQPFVRAASVYSTLDALLKVKRPESETGWEHFAHSRKIAWKTGTSFGFRDAWAVGVTSRYVVAVWCGNADGEGRAGLTGITAAAPVMFDVCEALPFSEWFQVPDDEMQTIDVCAESGYRPGEFCEKRIEVQVPQGNKVGVCPWHERIHFNNEKTYRVNANCYPVSEMQHQNWFVLPPALEYYFKRQNVLYATLPPLMPGCSETEQQMEFIYPREWNRLFIPVDLDGTPGKIIFDLAHRSGNVIVYWYLDDSFIGTTKNVHQFELRPEAGWHSITVTDNLGNSITKKFLVVNQ
ncbi:penicillin-binding protein 1C [Maribellus sediminis]|uniref:penicillin-binding protein 1C n=1 Tax=Maribellus sediminis TaxID=2696285 RepID=UPI00197E3E6A|nr:penicillin-binding protein 1C [Maribellus sediminis]